MATSVPPKKNSAFVMYIGLVSQSSRPQFQSNPTIASGDFKVSTDGGAFANLATLPTVTPAAGKAVKLSFSASEMNGDDVLLVCSDAAGAEWDDVIISIKTSARWNDDLAYPATSGRSMVVDAAGLVDANVVKLGPTGAGTAQTAADVGALTTETGADADELITTIGVAGAGLTAVGDTSGTTTLLARIPGTVQPQTGDSYARLGAPAGASVSADIAEIESETDTLLAGVVVTTNNDKTGYALTGAERNSIADAYLDRAAAVDTLTPRQVQRLEMAVLAGKSSGGPGSPVYRAVDDSKARVTATATANGDRTAVNTDAT